MKKSIEPKLLSRDEFRESTFKRDGFCCVMCGKKAVDAHHIIERRLWGDTGGYFIDNGASLFSEDHLKAEMTIISPEDIREACGITRVIVPDHLYSDHIYDN